MSIILMEENKFNKKGVLKTFIIPKERKAIPEKTKLRKKTHAICF